MLNTLMWSGLIEIDHIGFEEAMEVPLVEDQEMIQTCSPRAPQKPFVIWHSLAASGTGFEAP